MFEAPITRPSPGQLVRSLPTSVLSVSTSPQLDVGRLRAGRHRRRRRRRRRCVGLVAELELGHRDLGRILRRLAAGEALVAALGIALVRVADLPAVVDAALDHRLDVGLDVPLAVALAGVGRRRPARSARPGWFIQVSVLSRNAPASGRSLERAVLGLAVGVQAQRRGHQLAVRRRPSAPGSGSACARSGRPAAPAAGLPDCRSPRSATSSSVSNR